MRKDSITIVSVVIGYICFMNAIFLSFIDYEDQLLNTVSVTIIAMSITEVLCSAIYLKITFLKFMVNIFMGFVYLNIIILFTILVIFQIQRTLVLGLYIVNFMVFIYWFYTSVIYVLVREECCICYEDCDLKSITVLECGHYYHKECIRNWLLNNSTCPCCRQIV